MTLRKAKKMFDDAIIIKIWHDRGTMTKSYLENIGMFISEPGDTPFAKVLSLKVGRKSSYVISSHKALLQENIKQ